MKRKIHKNTNLVEKLERDEGGCYSDRDERNVGNKNGFTMVRYKTKRPKGFNFIVNSTNEEMIVKLATNDTSQ